MIYITVRAKKRGLKEAFINNLFVSLIYSLTLTIHVIIITFVLPVKREFIVFPFNLLMICFLVLFFPIFYLLIVREKRNIKKGKAKIEELKSRAQEILPLKYDIYRKLTHLVVLAIILFYFTLGYLIQNFFTYLLQFFPKFVSDVFYSIFTVEGDFMIFTQYLVMFLVGISLIGLLTADFVRILKPKFYPLKSVNEILRKKELHMRLGPQISMAVGCFSIIILYGLFQPLGPLIICTSMTIAIFGDIASNLIGRTIGKRKIRNTNKTYEGLIAGVVVAFSSGIIILILLRNFYIISVLGFFVLPLMGAIIIGVLDFLTLEIDDTLSYPIVTSTVLFLISILII